MKRRGIKKLLSLLLAAAVLFSLTACGGEKTPESSGSGEAAPPAQSGGETIEWMLGTTDSDPDTSSMNAMADFTKAFCDMVNERAEGRLVITPYYNSVLGGDVQLLTDIRDGNLDMYHGNPMSGIDSRLGFKALPYLLKDFDQVEALLANPDGELFLLLKEILADQNAYALSCGDGIFRGFLNSKRPVHTVSDLRDMTCRIYEDPCVAEFWNPICNSSIISWSECYTALQTGTADGMESAANVMLSNKFYEVSDYYSDIDWQWMGEVLMVNQERWNELDAGLQEIVQEAAWDAVAVEREKAALYRDQAYQMLQDNGIEVTILTDEERAEWIEYGRSCYEPIREIIGSDIYDRVLAAVEAYDAEHAG